MAILIDENTRVLVSGITGKEGSRSTKEMLDYGTKVVCGVTPKKGGQSVEGVPVYNSVSEAIKNHPEVNTSVLYVPPMRAKDSLLESINAKIPLIVCITENIPIHDFLECYERAKKNGVRIIGPSSVGIISSDICKVGSIGGASNVQYSEGPVGIISKSGGMTSETALLLKNNRIGTSTSVGIGGDVICGSDFVDILRLFEKDEKTRVIVLFCEIGGEYEQRVAQGVKCGEITKPIVAFVSGAFAENLHGVSIGHAGAIIEGVNATRTAKVKAFEDAGIKVAKIHHEIVDLVKEILDK